MGKMVSLLNAEITITSDISRWYNRITLHKQFLYEDVIVIPHAETQRFTYTVPVDKVFVLQAANVFVSRSQPPGTAKLAEGYITLTDAMRTYILHVGGTIPTVDNTSYGHTTGPIFMPAGYVLEAFTRDLSIAGAVDYGLTVFGAEIDA